MRSLSASRTDATLALVCALATPPADATIVNLHFAPTADAANQIVFDQPAAATRAAIQVMLGIAPAVAVRMAVLVAPLTGASVPHMTEPT